MRFARHFCKINGRQILLNLRPGSLPHQLPRAACSDRRPAQANFAEMPRWGKNESGQTLMETIIAIFVLTTALSSGLALMIYAFSNSATSQNEIIASNLAREGADVVRGMRDSNWLASDVKGGPWDLTACSDIGDRLCYPRAYENIPPYNNYNLGNGSYRLQFDGADWSLQNTPDYDLRVQSAGYYSHASNSTTPIFARMIKIAQNFAAPYTNENSNWELIVKSIVAWRGKNCTDFSQSADLETLSTRCKIIVEEHLTNWKDYK